MMQRASVGGYLGWIWQYRYFWISLTKIDLRTRYRGTVLGIGWSLLRPLVMTAVFCVIFSKLFGWSLRDYAPFVLVGMTFWGFISEAVTNGCETFKVGEPYIRQQPLPLAMFPLRTVLAVGFHSIVAICVAICLVMVFRGTVNPLVLLALAPTFVVLFVFGWSVAVLSGLANIHFPDSKHLLELFLLITFYLTPIIYPPELLRSKRGGALLIDLNPFAYLLELVRQPIVEGSLPTLGTYAIGVSIVLLVAAVAIACLAWLERRLIFWL